MDRHSMPTGVLLYVSIRPDGPCFDSAVINLTDKKHRQYRVMAVQMMIKYGPGELQTDISGSPHVRSSP